MAVMSPSIAFGRIATGVVLAIYLSGCSGKKFDFTGSWTGHHSVSVAPGTNPDVTYTLSEVKVTISANDRFNLFYKGFPFSGNVVIDGDKATLTATEIVDRPVAREQQAIKGSGITFELTGQTGDTILFQDPSDKDSDPVSLKRIATPGQGRP